MPSPEWETDVADRAQVLNECQLVTGGVGDLSGETTAEGVRDAVNALLHRLNLHTVAAQTSQQHWDPA